MEDAHAMAIIQSLSCIPADKRGKAVPEDWRLRTCISVTQKISFCTSRTGSRFTAQKGW